MRELRFAVRRLRGQPIFVVIAVLTIAIGAGGTTAILSVLYEVLLRPLPYKDADRLVFVWNSYPRMALPRASVSGSSCGLASSSPSRLQTRTRSSVIKLKRTTGFPFICSA